MDYVFNPFSGIPANKKSHVRGWSMHWAEYYDCEIATKEDDLSKADKLYLDHGVNFGGAMNLFGGVTDDIVQRIEQVVNHKGELFSLDIPMPDYGDQLSKRFGQATCSPKLTPALLEAFKAKLATAKTVTQADLFAPVVAIGDSHSTAFADGGSAVLRTNGATLHGALTKNTITTQLDALGYTPERVTLVYGSIDIRHHIGRQKDPMVAVYDLAAMYAKCVRRIQGDYLCDVEVAAPVPVEYEGRKIPQTGFYNGTPFFGSAADRLRWTENFVIAMRDIHKVKVIQPPSTWYYMDGELYAKTCMELSSSVHIAPTHYRRNNWGQS